MMRRIKLGTLLIACSVAMADWAQQQFTFVSYNCENLFDTRHDTLKADEDFTPRGAYHWTYKHFQKKLADISKVIVACGDSIGEPHRWQLPDIILLIEVENQNVMRCLTRYSLLAQANYRYVITDSPDRRGINVAMLYNAMSLKLIATDTLRITPAPGQRPTRDVLQADFMTIDGDTLHVFGVHAPSRRGGATATEPYRLAVVQRIMQAISRLRSRDADARIIVAGDFNDYSRNKSLTALVKEAQLTEVSLGATGLYHGKGIRGTYCYQGQWESLDHILVSQPLLPNVNSCIIFDAPWMVEQNKAGIYKPYRTHLGPTYHGGVSDHLPLVMKWTK